MLNSLRERTITGVGWSAISQVLNQGFGLVISIVLARVLGPAVYGQIGMIVVFTGFAAVFGDLGLGAAIVHRKNLEAKHLNAVFWANVAMGAVVTIVMAAFAPALAVFYKEPILAPLTAAIALRYLIDSFSVVQLALLSKEMRLETLAGIQISSAAISGALSLGLALGGGGVWSLVVQALGASLVTTIASWRLGQWRPQFSFDFSACKELFGYSSSLLGFNIVNYWARSFDRLLIGRLVGPIPLGVYSRAYTLMLMPLSQISSVLTRVMFPALSIIQDDKTKVKRVYLKVIGFIALITFPMMTGLYAVSDHFVLALLGDKWLETIPLIKIFCLIGLYQSITTTIGWLFTSQGRTGLMFGIGLAESTITVLTVVVSIRWGIWGVAWGYLLVNVIMCFPNWLIAGRLVDLRIFSVARHLAPTFACAATMGVVVWALGVLIYPAFTDLECLLVQVFVGAVLYVFLARVARLETWQEATKLLVERFEIHPYLRKLISSGVRD